MASPPLKRSASQTFPQQLTHQNLKLLYKLQVSSILQKSLLQAGSWPDRYYTSSKEKKKVLRIKEQNTVPLTSTFACSWTEQHRFKTLAQHLTVYSIKRCRFSLAKVFITNTHHPTNIKTGTQRLLVEFLVIHHHIHTFHSEMFVGGALVTHLQHTFFPIIMVPWWSAGDSLAHRQSS